MNLNNNIKKIDIVFCILFRLYKLLYFKNQAKIKEHSMSAP